MITTYFGKSGKLERVLKFTARKEQQEYALFIENFIKGTKTVGLVEGPTGIGKTLGYLLPIAWTGQKAVIATGTILLQDQVANKELPRLAELGFPDISFLTLKGRMNFLCPLRYDMYKDPLGSLMSDDDIVRVESSDQVKKRLTYDKVNETDEKVFEWRNTSTTLDKKELTFPVPYWDEINCEWEGCLRHDCHMPHCPYYEQINEAKNADILVVSHAMYFASNMLGKNKFFDPLFTVFDESHKLVDSISNAYGDYLSHTGLVRVLNRATRYSNSVKAECDSLIKESLRIFTSGEYPTAIRFRNIISYLLSKREELENLSIKARAEGSIERHALLKACVSSINVALDKISTFTEERNPQCVYFMERDRVIDGERLRKYLVDVSEVFAELPGKKLLTSATLSVGKSFRHIQSSLGLKSNSVDTLALPSPFNFQRNCLIYATKNMEDPNSPEFISDFASRVEQLLSYSKGGAFVLFTSWERLKNIKINTPYPIMKQGEKSVSQLVKWFKETPNAVLLGTASFWEGVDVVGDDLRLVIIERVPFPVPTEPLFKARSEVIKSKGGNAFTELALPSAVIKLKQGFGRLIRSSTDKGVVAVLDRRFAGYPSRGSKPAPWAKTALASLPPAKKTGSLKDVEQFFKER